MNNKRKRDTEEITNDKIIEMGSFAPLTDDIIKWIFCSLDYLILLKTVKLVCKRFNNITHSEAMIKYMKGDLEIEEGLVAEKIHSYILYHNYELYKNFHIFSKYMQKCIESKTESIEKFLILLSVQPRVFKEMALEFIHKKKDVIHIEILNYGAAALFCCVIGFIFCKTYPKFSVLYMTQNNVLHDIMFSVFEKIATFFNVSLEVNGFVYTLPNGSSMKIMDYPRSCRMSEKFDLEIMDEIDMLQDEHLRSQTISVGPRFDYSLIESIQWYSFSKESGEVRYFTADLNKS
jgi:hypothetical protein